MKLGLGVSAVPNKVFDHSTRPAFTSGLFFQFNSSSRLGFQTELNYSVKGYSYKTQGKKDYVSYEYLSLPLLANIRLNKNLYVQAGPEAGYLISQRSRPRTLDLVHTADKFDLGIAMGLFWNLNSRFGLDLRYVHGLTNAYKIHLYTLFTDQYEERKMGKNRALMISLYTRLKR